MKKSILHIGRALNKVEQVQIQGGSFYVYFCSSQTEGYQCWLPPGENLGICHEGICHAC